MNNVRNLEFKYLYNVKFNNKEFMVFNNKNIPFYLLEIDCETGNLKYPEFADFLFYFNLHNKKSVILENVNGLDDNNKRLKKMFKFVPMVLYKGQVVFLSLALLLAGCGKSSDSNSGKDKLLLQLEQEGIVAEYESYEEDIIFVHEYYCEEFNGKTIFCRNLDELKSYLGEGTPTYDDVINVFKDKKEIPEEYRDCIITNLKKMKDVFPDLDLTALYFNAKRMTFVDVDDEKMSQITGSPNRAACFNMMTSEVFYNIDDTSLDEFTIIHEVLGHGALSTLYYDENLNKNVYYGFYNTILKNVKDDNQVVYYPYAIGKIFGEGAADLIARKTTGKTQNSIYNYGEEMLRIFAELCNMDFSELLNSRGVNLYNKLYSIANINNPVSYAIDSDVIFSDYCNGIIVSDLSLKTLFEDLMIDSAIEKVKKGGNDVIEKTMNIMTNTYFDGNIELFYYGDVNMNEKMILTSYNPTESSKNVEEALSKNKKK